MTEVRSADGRHRRRPARARPCSSTTRPGLLDDDRLEELADAADRLVVAEPAFGALEALAPGVRARGRGERHDRRRRLRRPRRPSGPASSPTASACSRSTTRRPRPGGTGASATATSATPSSQARAASGGDLALVAATTAFDERARRRGGQRRARDQPARRHPTASSGTCPARPTPTPPRRRPSPSSRPAGSARSWCCCDRRHDRRGHLARAPLRAARRRDACP